MSRSFETDQAGGAALAGTPGGATCETSATSRKKAQSQPVSPQIAPRLAETAALPRLVDAGELAAYLGVDRSWVYAHAEELGARRLGS